FNFKDINSQQKQLEELKSPVIVNLEHRNFNKVHIGALADDLKNKGYGKEIYNALIENQDIISSSEGSATPEAKRVWNSLVKSGDYYWAKIKGEDYFEQIAVSKDKTLIDKFINAKQKDIPNFSIERGEPINTQDNASTIRSDQGQIPE